MSEQQPIDFNEPPDSLNLSSAEREMEAELSALLPAAPGFSAQHILAAAAGRRQRNAVWFWRGISGALAACLIAALWARNPSPADQQSLTITPIATAIPSTAAEPRPTFTAATIPSIAYVDDNYIALRTRVLQSGLEALPRDIRGPQSPSAHRWMTPVDVNRALDAQGRPIEGSSVQASPIVHFLNFLGKGTQL